MKICSNCKVEKDFSNFYIKDPLKGSLRSHCISCLKEKRYENKLEKSQKDRKYYLLNRENKIEKSKLYYKTNKESRKAYHKNRLSLVLQQRKERYHSDLNYKLSCNLRSRMHVALKCNKKANKTLNLLGCTLNEFKAYFENLFTEGMSWDEVSNGEIHIDHIIPCCSFDFTIKENQYKCFHYTNLQPLWAKDNREKYTKIY